MVKNWSIIVKLPLSHIIPFQIISENKKDADKIVSCFVNQQLDASNSTLDSNETTAAASNALAETAEMSESRTAATSNEPTGTAGTSGSQTAAASNDRTETAVTSETRTATASNDPTETARTSEGQTVAASKDPTETAGTSGSSAPTPVPTPTVMAPSESCLILESPTEITVSVRTLDVLKEAFGSSSEDEGVYKKRESSCFQKSNLSDFMDQRRAFSKLLHW